MMIRRSLYLSAVLQLGIICNITLAKNTSNPRVLPRTRGRAEAGRKVLYTTTQIEENQQKRKLDAYDFGGDRDSGNSGGGGKTRRKGGKHKKTSTATYSSSDSSGDTMDPYGGEESSYGTSTSSTNSYGGSGGSSSYGSGSSISSYGSDSSISAYGSDSSISPYGSGSSISSYGSDSSTSPYGSGSSISSYGTDYGSDSSISSYGGDSSISAYGSGSSGSSFGSSSYGGGNSWGSKSSAWVKKQPSIQVPLWAVLIFGAVLLAAGMICTAYQFEMKPEGTYAYFCRLSISTIKCTYAVLYNLYHCRLGEIQSILDATDGDGDDYTEDEIEKMKLRPGIAVALEREHNKALRKTKLEVKSSVELKNIDKK